MTATTDFARKLADIFSNGKGEVGLEVGADAGLAHSEFIQIPKCMVKNWVARLYDATDAVHFGLGEVKKVAKWDPKKGIKAFQSESGWVGSHIKGIRVVIHERGLWAYHGKDDGTEIMNGWASIVDVQVETPTMDDLLAFITVNLGHIRDPEFDEKTRSWIHACRYWAVTSGFVTTAHSREFEIVDNPTEIDPSAKSIAEFTVDFAADAWTASAARATSWRKTNHATGGDMVQGFPRKWLQKKEFLTSTAGMSKTDAQAVVRSATSAFYIATHASAPHAVLALMAGEVAAHWAEVDISHGLIFEWEVNESAKLRMVPNTQVAGTAMVCDAVVVLRMLIKESLAPLLTNQDQVKALMAAYAEVDKYGMLCGVYARWFLEGNPMGLKKRDFSQKDPAFSALVGELGIVATKYYENTTIGKSAALDSAANQSGEDLPRQVWSALGRQKSQMSAQTVTKAYSRIRGASGLSSLSGLASDAEAEVRSSVTEYNEANRRLAVVADVKNWVEVREDEVVSNMGTTSARAGAISGV